MACYATQMQMAVKEIQQVQVAIEESGKGWKMTV